MDESRPQRKAGIRCQRVGDEWIIYAPEAGAIHVVNAMAEFVWRMCDGSHTIAHMELRIADAYDVPAGTNVRADLEAMIRSFADQGMLARHES